MPVFSFSRASSSAMKPLPPAVHLRVEAPADHAALTNGERRLVHQRPGDALRQVVQHLQLVVQHRQRAGGKRGQLCLHRRQLLHRAAQGHQLPPSGRAEGDAAHEPLHVADAAEGQPQLLPGHIVVHQRCHGVQPPVNGHRVQQRLLQPRAQITRAHRRLGLVQHPQQTAPLLLGAQRLRQLQIAPRGHVQLHVRAGAVALQLVQMGQIGFLCLI